MPDPSLLTARDVERELCPLLPTLPFPDRPLLTSDVVDEPTLQDIARILKASPETRAWSTKPRLYYILRLLGCEGEGEGEGEDPIALAFQSEEYSDLGIPFSEADLPEELVARPGKCARFLELQGVVRARAEELAFDGRKAPWHRSAARGESVFTSLRQIGRNGEAYVDRVRNEQSGFVFTRHAFPRVGDRAKRRAILDEFANEAVALRRASHLHLANCVGTYTDHDAFALILEPVARYSLKAMLGAKEEISVPLEDMQCLPEYFGCLAETLASLHAQEVVHNDIKPENILIGDMGVFMCDVGNARSKADPEGPGACGTITETTTTSYCAPEVQLELERSERSDIWSLGRVYLEMLTVISGRHVKDLDAFLSTTRLGRQLSVVVGPNVWSTMERIFSWLEDLPLSGKYEEVRRITARMLKTEPSARPSAADIVEAFHRASVDLFCTRCLPRRVRNLATSPRVANVQDQPARAGAHSSSQSSEALSNDVAQLSPRTPSRQDRRLSLANQSTDSSKSARAYRLSSDVTEKEMSNDDSSIESADLERHDSLAAVHEGWQKRPDEELDVETRLLSYTVEHGDATTLYTEQGIADGSLKLSLYRTKRRHPWQVTRRLVVVDPDAETQTTKIYSNWLPLADITIALYDDHIHLAWSDCNHDVPEPPRNYVETHSKKYSAADPNHKIAIKVVNHPTSNAEELVAALCSPLRRKGRPSAPDQKVTLRSEETIGFFNCSTKGSTASDMMVTVGPRGKGTTTKMYLFQELIDLSIGQRVVESDSRSVQILLTGLRTLNYISDAQRLSKMTNKKGLYKGTELIPRKSHFTFNDNQEVFKFFGAVTGWDLKWMVAIPHLKERRKLVHDLGAADMALWRSTSGNAEALVLTFRLHREDSGRWISALLPPRGCIEGTKGIEASISVKSYSKGDMLERLKVRAVSKKHGARVTECHQTSRFKVTFSNVSDLKDFEEVVHESRLELGPTASLPERWRENSVETSRSVRTAYTA